MDALEGRTILVKTIKGLMGAIDSVLFLKRIVLLLIVLPRDPLLNRNKE